MSILSQKSKDLINDYMAERKSLPSIEFKTNSSMHDIAQSFCSVMINHSETAQTALESFDEMPEYVYGKEAMAELNQVADKMAAKINGALSEIREIGSMSRSVIQEADALFRSMAAKDPVMNKFMSMENEKIDFKFIQWNKLNDYCNESSLIFQVNSAYSIENANMIDLNTLAYHANQLPFVSAIGKPQYFNLADSKDFTEFLGTIKNEKAAEVGQILMHDRDAKRFMSSIIQVIHPVHGSIFNASLDVTGKFFDYMQAFGMIRDTLTEELSGFGGKEYEQLQNNMQIVQRYLDLIAYLVIGQRRTVYQEAYVLPNGMLNPDMQEARQEAGLTDTQVNNSIKYYMQSLGRIPGTGIEVDRLAKEAEMVDKHVMEQFTSAKFDAESKTKHYRADALRVTLEAKIADAKAKKIRGFNENQVRAVMHTNVDQFIVGQKTDFDAVNDFLMGLYHPFQMSERLYKQFKEAYMKSLPDYGQITNTDLKMIETKVIAKTVAEFCKKAFC